MQAHRMLPKKFRTTLARKIAPRQRSRSFNENKREARRCGGARAIFLKSPTRHEQLAERSPEYLIKSTFRLWPPTLFGGLPPRRLETLSFYRFLGEPAEIHHCELCSAVKQKL